MAFHFEDFVQFWKSIQDDFFSDLTKVFRRYLVEKPYDRFVRQKLVFQLKKANTKLNLDELKDFFKELCEDIEKKSGEKLKAFIHDFVEDKDVSCPEINFLEMLENQCRSVKKESLPDYKILSQIKRQNPISLTELTSLSHSIAQNQHLDHEDIYISECEAIGNEFIEFAEAKFAQENYQLSAAAFTKALEFSDGSKSVKFFSIKISLFGTLLNSGNLDEAFLCYQEIAKYFSELSPDEKKQKKWCNFEFNITVLASKYLASGKEYFEAKNFLAAEKQDQAALELYNHLGNSAVSSAVIGLLACSIELNKLDEANIFCKQLTSQMSRLSSEEKDVLKINKTSLAAKFIGSGIEFHSDEKYELAENHFRLALELCENSRDYFYYQAKTNICVSLINMHKQTDEAFALYKEVQARLDQLSADEKKQETWDIIEACIKRFEPLLAQEYEKLGNENLLNGDYKLAEQNYIKSYQCGYKQYPSHYYILSNLNKALTFLESGSFERAGDLYEDVEGEISCFSYDDEIRAELIDSFNTDKQRFGLAEIKNIENRFIKVIRENKNLVPPGSSCYKSIASVFEFISNLKSNPDHKTKFILVGFLLSKQKEQHTVNSHKFWKRKKETKFSQVLSKLFEILNFEQQVLNRSIDLFNQTQEKPEKPSTKCLPRFR